MSQQIKFLKFAAALCACLVAGAMATSCRNDILEEPLTPEATGDQTLLWISVNPADLVAGARAGVDVEGMYSLRIVLTDANGIVEHNHHADFLGGAEEYTYFFAASPGDKKIYLIANEESVTDMATSRPLGEILADVKPGTAGFDELINSVVFTPDYTLPLPMSSTYDIVLAEGKNVRTFNLVRTVTKFTFNFQSIRHDEVKVNRIIISSVADRNSLMARVGETDLFKTDATTGESLYWPDWLAEVARTTNDEPRNPANSQLNGQLGWITDYAIPADAETVDRVIDFGGTSTLTIPAAIETGVTIEPSTKDNVGPFYAPESRNFVPGTTSAQSYSVAFDIEGAQGRIVRPLTDVKALFRNTHVIVDVFMSKDLRDLQVMCTIDIQPYSSVELRPDFGLERDDEAQLVHRDKFGYLTDDNGNHVDAYGNPATLEMKDGVPVKFTDREGYQLNKDGYPVDEDGVAGYRDEETGRVRNFMGYIMNTLGQLIDKNGNRAYHDTSVTDSYVVRDGEGHLINYEGERINDDGTPVATT